LATKQKFLFLGGPWHGRTEVTSGSPWYAVPVPAQPLTTVTSQELLGMAYEYTEYTYSLQTYSLGKGRVVSMYVYAKNHNDMPAIIADFMKTLFNLYLEA
jgi:hypothetical protein